MKSSQVSSCAGASVRCLSSCELPSRLAPTSSIFQQHQVCDYIGFEYSLPFMKAMFVNPVNICPSEVSALAPTRKSTRATVVLKRLQGPHCEAFSYWRDSLSILLLYLGSGTSKFATSKFYRQPRLNLSSMKARRSKRSALSETVTRIMKRSRANIVPSPKAPEVSKAQLYLVT
jgi:hypothetical protein